MANFILNLLFGGKLSELEDEILSLQSDYAHLVKQNKFVERQRDDYAKKTARERRCIR